VLSFLIDSKNKENILLIKQALLVKDSFYLLSFLETLFVNVHFFLCHLKFDLNDAELITFSWSHLIRSLAKEFVIIERELLNSLPYNKQV